jgi:hypothetical protein
VEEVHEKLLPFERIARSLAQLNDNHDKDNRKVALDRFWLIQPDLEENQSLHAVARITAPRRAIWRKEDPR